MEMRLKLLKLDRGGACCRMDCCTCRKEASCASQPRDEFCDKPDRPDRPDTEARLGSCSALLTSGR